MRLSFDSIDEVKTFVASLKGTRGGKNTSDTEESAVQGNATHQAPAPLAPPTGGFGTAGPGNFPGAPQGGFPGNTGPVVDPAVQALAGRIVARMDGAVQKGETKAEDMLTWFRSQCGAEAANATLDQVKGVFLPKLSVPALENIAKLMGA